MLVFDNSQNLSTDCVQFVSEIWYMACLVNHLWERERAPPGCVRKIKFCLNFSSQFVSDYVVCCLKKFSFQSKQKGMNNFAFELWSMMFALFGIYWEMPKTMVELLACWQGKFGQSSQCCYSDGYPSMLGVVHLVGEKQPVL